LTLAAPGEDPDDEFQRQPAVDPAADPAVQQRPIEQRPIEQRPVERERQRGVHPASGGYLNVSPGLVQIPLNDGNVGYQWGLGGGYMLRTDGLFAIGLGANFEHGIGDLGIEQPYVRPIDHQLRAQFEMTPGVLLANDRVFLHAVVGVGYAALLQRWERADTIDTDVFHGVAFSPGVGISFRVFANMSVGAQVGANLQWFELRNTAFTAHNMDVKVLLGWMF